VVVAVDEVRTLAKRTQQSTLEIFDVVEVLQSVHKKYFLMLKNGSHEVKEAIISAQHISTVLAKIVENIQSVDNVTRVIVSSTRE
jgi:methyl-accepting chemotaxis protein